MVSEIEWSQLMAVEYWLVEEQKEEKDSQFLTNQDTSVNRLT